MDSPRNRFTLFVTQMADAGSRPARSDVDRFVCQAHRHGYASDCRVQRDARGRPTLLSSDGDPVPRRCSISHTRDWLACAFTDRTAIGIDIEVARPRDYVATGGWFFGVGLRERLAGATPELQRHLFYQAWTAYEALYKCGLSKRREIAPLLERPDTMTTPEMALRWLLGPRDLHACVAVIDGDTPPATAIAVLRADRDRFTVDERWRAAQWPG